MGSTLITEKYADKHYLVLSEILRDWSYDNGKDASKTGYNSIITLNYDIACDKSFEALELPFTYCCDWSGDNGIGYRLLKLHGSVNWSICTNQECGNITIMKNSDDLSPVYDSSLHYIEIAKKIYNTPCKKCQSKCNPFIIPPTWNKTAYSKNLTSIWKSAKDELEKATRLIIMGYSLPETDSFFKYLLALGLQKNESLQDIILIDPAKDSNAVELRKRYEDFLVPFTHYCRFAIVGKDFMFGVGELKKLGRAKNFDNVLT